MPQIALYFVKIIFYKFLFYVDTSIFKYLLRLKEAGLLSFLLLIRK